jgi:chromate transporter
MTMGEPETPRREVTVGEIFRTFLVVGATSFGGGLVVYLQDMLVTKRRWVDDQTFVELVAISQTLPGLYTVNTSIMVGNRLRGLAGAIAAVVGLCVPGALVMFAVGLAYDVHSRRPLVAAMLRGVAAAAVGLVTAVAVRLGRKSIERLGDLVFVGLTVLLVTVLHLRTPYALVCVGTLAILWHRPRAAGTESAR